MFALFLFLFAPFWVANEVHADRALYISDDGRAAGYVSLAWQENDRDRHVLQQRDGGAWVTIYEGPDLATTLSGLPDGTYNFRVDNGNGGWSEVLPVEISHHPLSRAWAFFGGGLGLFLVLLFLVYMPVGHAPNDAKGREA